MSEIKRIADQLERAFEGGAWHGPSVREVLDGVTAEQARSRPLPNAHSIWEITLHIAAWEDAVRRRLQGEKVELTDAEDWPAIGQTTEAAWAVCRAGLERGHRALAETVARFDETQLGRPPGANRSIAYVQIHGVIQHDLYHAGQIAVLRKAVPAPMRLSASTAPGVG